MAKKSKASPKRRRSKFEIAAGALSSRELIISLVAISALHVEDQEAQAKVLEAVRRLTLLEKAAADAGLVSHSTGE